MGRDLAATLADIGGDVMLQHHLQHNHYPPVNSVFIPVAKQAIAAGVKAITEEDRSDLDKYVEMPNGLLKTLGDIVSGLHLECFIDAEVERLEGSEDEG